MERIPFPDKLHKSPKPLLDIFQPTFPAPMTLGRKVDNVARIQLPRLKDE